MLTLPRLQSLRSIIASRSLTWEPLLLAAYLGWLAVVVRKFAAVRPLWYDELFTLHLARVASPRELLGHLATGVDLNPPLLYVLTRASVLVFGEAAWAIRLPALLGLLLGLIGFYAFLRRHCGAMVALTALSVSIAPVKIWAYFLEARPYGLVFGFAGLALVCWQRAGEGPPRRRWLISLALAAVLGVSSHYYFVTVLAALGVAEVARLLAIRRLDYAPTLALACGGVALLAWQPLWSVAPRDYAAGFWAKTTFNKSSVQETLALFLEPALAVPVLLAVVAAFLLARRASAEGGMPRHQVIALCALALTPVLGVFLGATLTGGFYFRYVLPAVFGFAGLFALTLDRVGRGAALPLGFAFLAFGGFGLPVDRKPYREFFQHEANGIVEQTTFLEMHCPSQRVVIETGFDFGRIWHYNTRSFQPLFLADADLALLYTKTDTTERAVEKLKRVTAVPALTPAELMLELKTGKAVYYYGPGTAWGYNDLTGRGVRFEKVTEQGANKLYRLTLKPG